jgi:hypothetical protein
MVTLGIKVSNDRMSITRVSFMPPQTIETEDYSTPEEVFRRKQAAPCWMSFSDGVWDGSRSGLINRKCLAGIGFRIPPPFKFYGA